MPSGIRALRTAAHAARSFRVMLFEHEDAPQRNASGRARGRQDHRWGILQA